MKVSTQKCNKLEVASVDQRKMEFVPSVRWTNTLSKTSRELDEMVGRLEGMFQQIFNNLGGKPSEDRKSLCKDYPKQNHRNQRNYPLANNEKE